MGSFDGAEICEVVGLYLLSILAVLLGEKNVGLYRDVSLAAINSCNGPMLDRTRKSIISLFKKEGLNITIDTNLTETGFLHITFNVVTGKFLPYQKSNNKSLYINAKSNHTPTMTKYIPNMINKPLSDLSCNKEEFKKAKPIYENSLKESGFKLEIKYKNLTA